jgi:hypothetical protein
VLRDPQEAMRPSPPDPSPFRLRTERPSARGVFVFGGG